MIWLADWLKSIIFVILLATFVDILLPGQTMQRYVKTVMSLFILLTLFQPIFYVFHKQTTMEEMFAGAETLFQSASGKNTAAVFNSSQGASNQMQTLRSIEQQAEQLKERQDLQSHKLMRDQIGVLMKQNIEQASGMLVQNLQVETEKDASGQMQIRKVTVQAALQPTNSLPASGQTGSLKPVQIEPVKPIDISISIRARNEPLEAVKREGSDATSVTNPSNGHEQEKTQIRMLLNKVWQVPPERIEVEVTEGKVKL